MTARPRGRAVARRRTRTPRRGHGYVLTGLLLGFGLGLLVAWVLLPVRYTDTAPDRLRADFKDAYRVLIALAYWGNPDLVRARSRLALLGDPNPAQVLAVQAQQAQAQGARVYEVEALRRLAADLSRAAGTPLPTPPRPSPTPTPGPTDPATAGTPPPTPTLAAVYTPTPTPTPRPTLAAGQPTATPAPFFRVFQQDSLCDPARPARVQIEVYDADAQPLPGIPLVVRGPQGESVIYTGLQPERGLGYADFVMADGATYRVQVQSGSETVDGLHIVRCRGDEGTYAGGWRVIFMAVP